MARKVAVELFDDIDDSNADETVKFGVDGTNYEIDLNAKHAEELLEISKKAEWKVLATPLYVLYSNQFQNNVEEMIKNSRKKNIDAAALSYVEVTLTCVKCHKHVREKRMARLDR